MSRPAESSKRLIHNSRGNHSDSGAAKPERLKTRISGTDGFSLGRQEIDLRYTEQLIDAEQTAALGLLLKYAVEHLADGRRTLPEIVQFLWKISYMVCPSYGESKNFLWLRYSPYSGNLCLS